MTVLLDRTQAPSEAERDLGPAIRAHPGLGLGLTIFWGLLSVGALVGALFTDQTLFLVFGWATCLVVTLPLLDKRYDLVSPWSLVVVTIYIGCGLRPWFIAREIEGGPRSLDSLFLLGREPAFFTRPSLIFVAGMTLLTIGYLRSGKRPLVQRPTNSQFTGAAGVLVALCAVIGFVAFVLFAQRTGGFSLERLSSKRTSITGLDLTGYESQGTLRALNELSRYAYWIAVAMFAYGGKRYGLPSVRGFILLVLFVNAAALPFYASSRSDAAYTLIIGLVIGLCLRPSGGRRTGRAILRGAIVVTAIISVLTVLRSSATSDFYREGVLVEAIGGTFVYTRSFTDIPTASQTIEAIPDKLEPAYGSTYLAWAVAPIPRAVWPEKPLVSSGPVIGVKVFGQASSGVPPGLIAEAFWNFGLGGALLIPPLVGIALRRVYERWRPRLSDPYAVVVYCGAFMRLGEGVLTGGIGFAVFQALLAWVTLGVLMHLATAPRPEAAIE